MVKFQVFFTFGFPWANKKKINKLIYKYKGKLFNFIIIIIIVWYVYLNTGAKNVQKWDGSLQKKMFSHSKQRKNAVLKEYSD